MKDRVHLILLQHPTHRLQLAHVAKTKFHSIIQALQDEVGTARAMAIQHDDAGAQFQQLLAQMRADKACATGKETDVFAPIALHRTSLCRGNSASLYALRPSRAP